MLGMRGCVVMVIEASQLLIYCVVSYRKVGKLELVSQSCAVLQILTSGYPTCHGGFS